MIHLPARIEGAVAAAVARAYADAGVGPPTVASASPVVPLRRILQGQPLTVSERAGLTRASVGAFLARELGGLVEVGGPPTERLSGCLYAVAEAGWILVERAESVARRRFTIAHKLGHWLLHARPCFQAGALAFGESLAPVAREQLVGAAARDGAMTGQAWHVTVGAAPTAGPPAWEEAADQFATELLMPATLCEELLEALRARCGGRRADLAGRLASELLVSPAAMRGRLRQLGLGDG